MSETDKKTNPTTPAGDPLAEAKRAAAEKELQRKIEILGTAITFGPPVLNAAKAGVIAALADGSLLNVITAVLNGTGLSFATTAQLGEMDASSLTEELNARLHWIAAEGTLLRTLSAIPDANLKSLAENEHQIRTLADYAKNPFHPGFEQAVKSVIDYIALDMAVPKEGLSVSKPPIM